LGAAASQLKLAFRLERRFQPAAPYGHFANALAEGRYFSLKNLDAPSKG